VKAPPSGAGKHVHLAQEGASLGRVMMHGIHQHREGLGAGQRARRDEIPPAGDLNTLKRLLVQRGDGCSVRKEGADLDDRPIGNSEAHRIREDRGLRRHRGRSLASEAQRQTGRPASVRIAIHNARRADPQGLCSELIGEAHAQCRSTAAEHEPLADRLSVDDRGRNLPVPWGPWRARAGHRARRPTGDPGGGSLRCGREREDAAESKRRAHAREAPEGRS